MSIFVRMARAPRWYREQAQSLLEQDDIPSDPIADLNTTENSLSIFLVNEDRSNLEQTVAAQAGTRMKADDAGYIVFSSDLLSRVGIAIDDSHPGTTADEDVNSRHRDLIQLSGKKLIAFVREVMLSSEPPETLPKEDVIGILKEGVSAGRIDPGRLPDKVRKQLSL